MKPNISPKLPWGQLRNNNIMEWLPLWCCERELGHSCGKTGRNLCVCECVCGVGLSTKPSLLTSSSPLPQTATGNSSAHTTMRTPSYCTTEPQWVMLGLFFSFLMIIVSSANIWQLSNLANKAPVCLYVYKRVNVVVDVIKSQCFVFLCLFISDYLWTIALCASLLIPPNTICFIVQWW